MADDANDGHRMVTICWAIAPLQHSDHTPLAAYNVMDVIA